MENQPAEMTVTNRLPELMGRKAANENRRITLAVVAKESGVKHNILMRWYRNQIKVFDARIAGRLCRYFDCGVGDLLIASPIK